MEQKWEILYLPKLCQHLVRDVIGISVDPRSRHVHRFPGRCPFSSLWNCDVTTAIISSFKRVLLVMNTLLGKYHCATNLYKTALLYFDSKTQQSLRNHSHIDNTIAIKKGNTFRPVYLLYVVQYASKNCIVFKL